MNRQHFSSRKYTRSTARQRARRRVIGRIIIATAACAVLWSIVSLHAIFIGNPKKVQTAIHGCFAELDSARTSGAATYAAQQFSLAESLSTQAMSLWNEQNRRLFFLRRMNDVSQLACECSLTAHAASVTSLRDRDSLKQSTMRDLVTAKQTLATIQAKYKHLPISSQLRKRLVAGEMLVVEAERALQRKEYDLSAQRVRTALHAIEKFEKAASDKLDNYMLALPQWRQWTAETIDYSRKSGSYALIVDKFANACRLYHKGRLVREYHAEFGPNWIGPKLCQGDKATPEGIYRITRKKGPGQTKYHRALEFNYPNEFDRERFASAKKQGRLPANARLGGLLEIHGGGGKQVNWTEGCVSLCNRDMEQLYALISVGTRLAIVGTVSGDGM